MLTWDEIKYIARALLGWWWVIILAIAVSAGTAFYLSAHETRFYSARATILVGNAFSANDQYEIESAQTLARFYSELVHRERILKPVQQQLQLPFPWEVIAENMLRTNVVPDANLLEIFITDSNPDRASAIANSIGKQLVGYSPTTSEEIRSQQQLIEQQVQASQARMEQLKASIDRLSTTEQTTTSPSALNEINQRLTELNTSLGQEQNFFNTLSSAKKSSYVTSLTLFEPAITPATPLPSKRPLTIGVAGLAGLLLSLVAVFILERFDRRWWRARDLEMRFKIADLGQIPVGPALRMIGQTFIGARLRAVQEVQTNIFLSGASDAQTLMITSPASNEARAAFTVDLADLLAHAGHKVLLVDADFTGAPLTRLLQAQGASQRWTHLLGQARSDVWMDLKPTALPNVTLLPGNLDSTTPALVPSLRWRELIESVHGVADFIIFDGPAALHGPDAALLAPHVGGIVLAIDPNKDSPEQIATSIKRLQHHEGSRLLGAVTFVPSKPQSRIISFWRQFHGQKPPEQLARDAAAGQSTVDAAHLIAKGQLSEPVAAGGGAGARPTEPDIPIADAYDSKEAASIPGSTATRSEPIGVPQEVARRPKPYAHRTLRSNRRAPK